MKGKVALVTGSTRGIGLAIARAFAREGAAVMLHGLGDPAELAGIRTALEREYRASVRVQGADLNEAGSAARLVQETAAAFGRVDILVNNAGLQRVAPVETFPPEDWDALHAIMVRAPFEAIRAALPGMRQRAWGRVINIASVHGLVASPFKSAYVAAKHALIGLTRTVALEVAEDGITCNAICPGYVRTDLVESQVDAQARAHGLSRERVIQDVLLAAQPTKRFIEVDEVAALAVFLCGEHARSITGAALAIDGGWTTR